MNEFKLYHTALEESLLNGKELKNRIDAQTAKKAAPQKTHVSLNRKWLIPLIAAALLLISSVTFAAVMLRNQAFKEQTNAMLQEQIEIVAQPLDTETNEGWQPNHLILFDDVLSTMEVVSFETESGTIYLDELSCHGRTELWALFRFEPKENVSFRVDGLAVSINGAERKTAYWADPFDSEKGSHAGDRYYANASFVVSNNPFLPGATFVFTGKVNGEPFTLNYMFTEETYQTLQQDAVNTLKEHEDIVNAIPDEGSEVNYHRDNRTLLEVAVNGNLMYFTEKGDDTMSTMDRPYSEYDSGTWPVIDGRISEFYYLGNVDQQYPEGTVYSTYLPYPEDRRPEESLISFNAIMFRYEWATGKVTVPKDEAEYEAWRKESSDLSAPYCDEDWIWQFEAKGESFSVTDLVFHNHSMIGLIGVVLSSEEALPRSHSEMAEEAPQVFINGVPLKHEGEIDPLSSICGYVSKDQHRIGYMMLGAATADLPEMFTLTVTWHGETAEIRLKLSDVIREKSAQSETYYDEVFDY